MPTNYYLALVYRESDTYWSDDWNWRAQCPAFAISGTGRWPDEAKLNLWQCLRELQHTMSAPPDEDLPALKRKRRELIDAGVDVAIIAVIAPWGLTLEAEATYERERDAYSRWARRRPKANHTQAPAFRSLVEMGEDILPLIFRDTERRLLPAPHWFTVLRAITGEKCDGQLDHTGWRDSQRIREALWLSWGVNRGYAAPPPGDRDLLERIANIVDEEA